jgi:hypothetical protein
MHLLHSLQVVSLVVLAAWAPPSNFLGLRGSRWPPPGLASAPRRSGYLSLLLSVPLPAGVGAHCCLSDEPPVGRSSAGSQLDGSCCSKTRLAGFTRRDKAGLGWVCLALGPLLSSSLWRRSSSWLRPRRLCCASVTPAHPGTPQAAPDPGRRRLDLLRRCGSRGSVRPPAAWLSLPGTAASPVRRDPRRRRGPD